MRLVNSTVSVRPGDGERWTDGGTFVGTQALFLSQHILKVTADHLNQWNPCPS
jgi:hypothetical protein